MERSFMAPAASRKIRRTTRSHRDINAAKRAQ